MSNQPPSVYLGVPLQPGAMRGDGSASIKSKFLVVSRMKKQILSSVIKCLSLVLGFAIPSAALAEFPVSEKLSKPSYDDLGKDQELAPLFAGKPDKSVWEQQRPALRKSWDELLGKPEFAPGAYDKTAKVIETFEQPEFRGTILQQPTGPDGAQQLVLVMEPKNVTISPRPGAVVPFYHPDAMAGFDLAKRTRITEKVATQFGRHLVQQGYVVVCPEAFPYNTVPQPANSRGLNHWRVAAEKIHQDHPNWTGMGKLVHDTQRAIDLLLEQPDIDRDRIALIGHSLGGKMAFYTGCLDPRVKATIATDFGIGWDFTNWSDPWYLGDKITGQGFSLAHHQLLALHAPRAFLIVAGQYDKPESWQYLNAARPVYSLFGREHALGMIDHASGHTPTQDSMRQAYQWLAEQLELEPRDWKF
ncbi:Alpha/beta hydrolase family protein [Novipirellula galeiformis]|uniref:Alpha/beta hydrolase family protein n=1 Tax=Novipirellula galeiformis TaxID=2528004 RepID=A0A5C6BIW4_9BACT|nr:dienelactone hydrolase family protein [Novipirellula galeiformis]TWU11149.1 Alpha/beta hydrolase family protein [Novipirellula galeiformis]